MKKIIYFIKELTIYLPSNILCFILSFYLTFKQLLKFGAIEMYTQSEISESYKFIDKYMTKKHQIMFDLFVWTFIIMYNLLNQ